MVRDNANGQKNQQDIIETESVGTQTMDSAAAPTSGHVAAALVENTLDVANDSIAVLTIKPPDIENPTLTRLPTTLDRHSSFGSSVIQTASNGIKRLLQDGRASFSRLTAGHRRDSSAAAHAFKGLRFISNADGANGWPAIEKRFDDFAVHGSLPRSRFGQCIYNSQQTNDSTEFAAVLFDALARRRNITRDSITREELKEFWDQISDQSFDSRLQTFFDMVDKNADGVLNVEEVREIISLSASANKLSKIKERAEEYARLIMEELDAVNDGYIEIYSLEMLLLKAQSQSVRGGDTEKPNLTRILSQNLKTTHPLRRWYKKSTHFLEDRWKRGWVVALWLSICVGLFTWKFIQYRHRAVYHVMGYCVCVAKGGAETLKFNMALVLFPVCRNTITRLRNKTKLGALVPFDDNLNFHKVITSGIAVGVGLHAISHLTCDFPRLLHASDQAYIPMKLFFGNTRPNNYWWFVKGIEGWTGILMVVLMAIAFTLALPCFRSGGLILPKPFNRIVGFNSFWYTHHLFVIVYVLLIIHGFFLYLTKEWYKKTTWMYLAIPMILYAGERLTRIFRSKVQPVKIMKVEVYQGDVLNLHVTKPEGFEYQSGQYMFVHCAAVSPFEWHPFSITSAPGDDYLSVHIRAAGDWTRQIKEVFSKACGPSNGEKNGVFSAEYDPSWDSSDQKLPRVMIDGPYGAPAQEYKNYEVVLLVGLGIGATPFISVVKDILNNLELLEVQEAEGDVERGFKTRQAYLYWMTREQGSFEWFREMMNEVAESDKKGAIELRNYCTSVFEKGDVRSALITMLQWLNYAKNGIDVVSGTKVKTHFARPDWRKVFKHIARHHQGKRIGVFYCGKPNPVKELQQLALEFSTSDGTKFDFHKENF